MKASRILFYTAACAAVVGLAGMARGQTTISLPLATGAAGKISLGTFSGGTSLQVNVTGTGDLVSAAYQTNPDGTLAATATGSYVYANAGATITAYSGGNGINNFSGGGANYDFSSSGYGFAGTQTTDTTDASAIRFGAVVGTFATSPARTDWFLIGTSKLVVIPGGGATLYVAVNDVFSSDNHGSYSLTYTAVPEPAGAATVLATVAVAAAMWRRRRLAGARQSA